ncbi:MAG: nucleotide exchange factor GrpE [Candidatus Gastranaerophilales bacterium]|nr:nucleotide exchange factor GrpE [Candidatus Gastranaerophilales bacterium]
MNDTKNPFKEQLKEDIVQEEQNPAETDNLEEIEEETNEEIVDETNEPSRDEKYEELNNKYIRLAADFDNFRKRTATEKEELSKYTTAEVLKKLTASLDTFDRAKESLKDIDNPSTIKEGYEVAYKQLTDALTKIGLVEIEALGKPFNPNEHEAITQVQTDEFEPDTVAVVAQKGYKYQDKIVRPALVGVARSKENE